MGFNNPSVRWSEMARLLGSPDIGGDSQPDGGDGPAFSRKRESTSRPRSNGPRMPCPTPNCTRTRRSPSSTAPPHRRNWRKRPNGWGCTRSRSPTTTGFYGIARFAEAAEHLQLKTVFGAELTLGTGGDGDVSAPPVGLL